MNEKDLKAALRSFGLSEEQLPAELVRRCTSEKLKIATAESCTGGLISMKITSVAGSSAVFDCGVCSYANDIKHRILGVREKTLSLHGAVSAQTAIQMAQGVRKLAKADIGISVTGIAGPDGGTSEKPVGLVYIGVSSAKESFSVSCLFNEDKNNDREQVREYASQTALYFAIRQTENI